MNGTNKTKAKHLTNAMGHQFEDSLSCKNCKLSWWDHQDNPTECAMTRIGSLRFSQREIRRERHTPRSTPHHDLHAPESEIPRRPLSSHTPSSAQAHDKK